MIFLFNFLQSLAYTLGYRPFRAIYLSLCAGVDELMVGIATSTYFAFYHRTSTRDASEGLAVCIITCIILMCVLNMGIIAYELYKRSNMETAGFDDKEPEVPFFAKH